MMENFLSVFWTYADIAFKLTVGLVAFVLVLRTTNKGQLTQMTPLDLIGNFVMGGLIGGIIYNPDIGVLKFIAVLLIWQVLIVTANRFRKHSETGRKMIVGSEIPLVVNGKFLQEKFKEVGLDVGDFATMLHMQGVHSMCDVRHVQLEPNGHLYVVMKDGSPYSSVVIKNGSIDQGALDMLGQDESWLLSELKKAGYDKPEDIFFAEWVENSKKGTAKLFAVTRIDDTKQTAS